MKSTLLTAALLVALAGTASASNEVGTYNREDRSQAPSVTRNDCVNRLLSAQCPLTDMGKNEPPGHGLGTRGTSGIRGL
jgi:hypothetical protein